MYPLITLFLSLKEDGIGLDIWKASKLVFDAAVEKAYGGDRKIQWKEIYAGEEAFEKTGSWLPDETIEKYKRVFGSYQRTGDNTGWRRNEIS